MKKTNNIGLYIFLVIFVVVIFGLCFFAFDFQYKFRPFDEVGGWVVNPLSPRELNERLAQGKSYDLKCSFNGTLLDRMQNKDPCGDFERGNDCCSVFDQFTVFGKECC